MGLLEYSWELVHSDEQHGSSASEVGMGCWDKEKQKKMEKKNLGVLQGRDMEWALDIAGNWCV